MAKKFPQNLASAAPTSSVDLPLKNRLQVWRGGEKAQAERSAAAYFERALACQAALEEFRGLSLSGSPLLGQQVRQFVTELLLGESGYFSGTEMLRAFSASFQAEPQIREYLQQLLSDAEAVSDHAGFFSRFEIFAAWYLRRTRSLSILALESHAELADEMAAQIFDLSVALDHEQCGCSGFYVASGLRLRGLLNEPLLLKVYVLDGEGPVGCAAGWQDWSDQTGYPQPFIVRERPNFVASVPVIAVAQHQIIDQIHVFVPYAALNLGVKRTAIVVEALLFDSQGEQLARVQSSRFALTQSPQDKHLPAPAHLALWAAEPGRGNLLQKLEAELIWHQGLDAAELSLRVSFEATLIGQNHKVIGAGIRLINRAGEMLALDDIPPSEVSFAHLENFFSVADSFAVLRVQALELDLKSARTLDLQDCLVELCLFDKETQRVIVGSTTSIDCSCALVLDSNYAQALLPSAAFSLSDQKLILNQDAPEGARINLLFRLAPETNMDLSYTTVLALLESGENGSWIASNLVGVPPIGNGPRDFCLTFRQEPSKAAALNKLRCRVVAFSETGKMLLFGEYQIGLTRLVCRCQRSGSGSRRRIEHLQLSQHLLENKRLNCTFYFNLSAAELSHGAVFRLNFLAADRTGRESRWRKAAWQSQVLTVAAAKVPASSAALFQLVHRLQFELTPYLNGLLFRDSTSLECQVSLEQVGGEEIERITFALAPYLRLE